MPLLRDLAIVRALLDGDRSWAAYAIGDLAPGFREHAEWHAPVGGGRALVLVYRGFDPPILFAMGAAPELQPLLAEVAAPHVSLHVQPHVLGAMDGLFVPTSLLPMNRMVLTPDRLRAVSTAGVAILGARDLDAIAALYEDGRRRGEGPTFFAPSMLRQGTFRGIWSDGALVSVAGTHLYSPALGVCAIGNVYTRSDRRGHGYAAAVTSAVVAQALADGVTTIVLNVGRDNRAAQRVYERLGFTCYCEFLEGEASRAT